MNIDITNYLSTIKHISNGTQFTKNTMSIPRPIEAMANRIERIDRIDRIERADDNIGSKKVEVKIEAPHDDEPEVFLEEASEVEDDNNLFQPQQQLNYSPIRHEVKREEQKIDQADNVY